MSNLIIKENIFELWSFLLEKDIETFYINGMI